MLIRAVSTDQRPCKVCDAPTSLFGVVDFNRSCEEARGRYLPLSGIAIYYRKCPACGFLFTDSFDDWTEVEFKKYIYNDEYFVLDPDYRETRPVANAQFVARLFDDNKAKLHVLDYGGGDGRFGDALRTNGFPAIETYDPFAASSSSSAALRRSSTYPIRSAVSPHSRVSLRNRGLWCSPRSYSQPIWRRRK
jgi:hypothetical protein